MENARAMNFSGTAYVRRLGERLVADFEFAAHAGTPGLVGASKEHPARLLLSQLIPDGFGIGSGIVVDSHGNMSKQQDLVIYETFAPIFSINNTPEATFYPVEGVVAVGEVKSKLAKEQLRDSFEKIRSVKSLGSGCIDFRRAA